MPTLKGAVTLIARQLSLPIREQENFTMNRRVSAALLGLQLLALLVGTQMPGAWRSEGVQMLHAPSYFSSLAHFLIFAGMTMVAAMRPLAWPVKRILLAALLLALLTEGLQFLAVDRHPRWLDIGIDMAGTVAGLVLARLGSSFSGSR